MPDCARAHRSAPALWPTNSGAQAPSKPWPTRKISPWPTSGQPLEVRVKQFVDLDRYASANPALSRANAEALAAVLDHLSRSLVQGQVPADELLETAIDGLQKSHLGRQAAVERSIDAPTASIVDSVAQGKPSDDQPTGMLDVDEAPSPAKSRFGLRNILKELVAFLAFLPGCLMVLNIVLGSILAAIEGWSFHTGWQYCFSIQCGLAAPLGEANNVNPVTTMGRVWTSVVAAWTLGFAGALSELCSSSALVDLVTWPGRWAASHLLQCLCCQTTHALTVRRQDSPPMLLSLALNASFVMPVLLFVPCLLFGAVLSSVETYHSSDCRTAADLGLALESHVQANLSTTPTPELEPCATESWSYASGVWYLSADAAGLPNPLIPQTPQTEIGQFFAVYVGILTFECAIIALNIGGDLGSEVISRSRALPSCC